MELNFRTLKANEIECKAIVVGNAIEVSLHVKAHTCTRILNETVTPMGWEKVYTNGNKNCIVRIWDNDKKIMVAKEDCGGPMTDVDGAKGQASNGFKRVCALGWGLGLELYSQPTIRFPKNDSNTVYDTKGGLIVSERYDVKEIEYNKDKEITKVVIVDSKGTVVYDGPDENGQSRVAYPEEEEEVLVIPADADCEEISESDECEENEPVDTTEDCDVELPDNTDEYESSVESAEDFTVQDAPYSEKKLTYREEIEAEIKRTHVKQSDVMKSMGISSFDELSTVYEEVVVATIKKLKSLKTYEK